MWDQSSQLVLIDQVEELVQVTTCVSNIAFAEDADRSDEDAGKSSDNALESSLTNGVPTENEGKVGERSDSIGRTRYAFE